MQSAADWWHNCTDRCTRVMSAIGCKQPTYPSQQMYYTVAPVAPQISSPCKKQSKDLRSACEHCTTFTFERFEVVVHDDKALYKYQISFFTFFAYLGCKGGNQSYRDKFCIEYSSIAECWECGRVMRCCLSTECCVTVDPADCYNVLVITGPGTESCMCKCLLLCVSQAQEFYSLQ